MRLSRKDVAIICLISLAYFMTSAYNLGQIRSPTTYVSISEGEILIEFGSTKAVSSVYLMISTKEGNMMASITAWIQGEWNRLSYLNEDNYYKWARAEVNAVTDKIKVFFFRGGNIYEFIALDGNNEKLEVRSIKFVDKPDNLSNLIDEQEFFQYPPGFESGMYFDEVYFARTASEYLRFEEPSEWTHPPLGKLIIAAGIRLFSFSPFGWRIMGVVFASIMAPLMYLIGFEMFKTRFAAVASSVLFSFDFMRFTMGRIATTDTFLVFFLIASTLFFYLNLKYLLKGSGFNYKYIALGVFFFFLAFSVKWTAAFSFAGEITLLLIVLFRDTIKSRIQFVERFRSYVKPLFIFAGLTLVSSLVYFSTYIPYMIIGHGLEDVIKVQWNMFSFHSGLVSAHPYASDWWTWLFMLKPIKFSLNELPSVGISSINAMGNPLIWWGGLAAMILALYNGVKERDLPSLFIGVLFISQLVPYVLISRELFIYHYYPETPLLVLATVGIMNNFWKSPMEKKIIASYILVAFILFLAFYPVISGLYAPNWYIDYLRWLRGWDF